MRRVTREMMRRGWRRKGLRLRLGLLGGLYAGLTLSIYTFAGGRYIFMEKPLSLNHKGLEARCGNCHRAFEGVSDTRCAKTCHTRNYKLSLPVDFRVQAAGIPYKQEIHYYLSKFEKKKDCLLCHPAPCHTRDLKKQPPVPMPLEGVQCEAKNRDNLVLPQPAAESTCKNCHSSGCKRSTRCYHCHQEHRDGLPITLNRPTDVFPGTPPTRLALMTPRGRLLNYTWTEQTSLNFERTRGRMHELNCQGCHPGILHRRPATPDDVDKSKVSRSIFRHESHGHRQYFRCSQCHVHRFLIERDRDENIFTMEACSKKCHYPDDCAGCHRFHDPINMPGEHVDWPETLKVYYKKIAAGETATGEVHLSDYGIVTGEGGAATVEVRP